MGKEGSNAREPAGAAVGPEPTVPPPREPRGPRPGTGRKSRAPRPRKPPVSIPPLLLERDEPEAPPPGKPAAPAPSHAAALNRSRNPAESDTSTPRSSPPELFVAARDPQWLYAHWDLSDDQVRHYNALAFEGHLSVRVHTEPPGGPPVAEAHVLPESHHWFIYVGPGAAAYVAQLGYYDAQRQWQPIAASPPVRTPPASPTAQGAELFATLPLDVPLAAVAPLVDHLSRPVAGGSQPQPPGTVADAVWAESLGPVHLSRLALTPEQRRALSETLGGTEAQSGAISSGEFLLGEVTRTVAAPGPTPPLGANPVEPPSQFRQRDRPAPAG